MERKRIEYPTLPAGDGFIPYLRKGTCIPPLDLAKIKLTLYEGAERTQLKTPVTGDVSLVVTYKNREGAVASLSYTDADLQLLQLQGAKEEGFRINTGLRWVELFADQALQIAKHPESDVQRITMPPLAVIQGIIDATEDAMNRYKHFASRLGLNFSDVEGIYVRDVKQL